MNRISHKIQTYYDLISPQKNVHSQEDIKSFDTSLYPVSNCEENHQKNSFPEVYFETPSIEIASEVSQRNNTHIIDPSQDPKEINKKVLRNSLLNSLEGFNSNVVVFEKRNNEDMIFFSMIFSYLTYLKTAVENFKRDDISCVCRCSFFLSNGVKMFDLLRGLSAEVLNIQDKCEMIFLDINEMIEHFRKIANGIQIKEGCQIYFQNSNLFYDSKETLSWKGKFSLSGFFLEKTQSCLEYSDFYHSMYQGINNEEDQEVNEETLNPNFESLIRDMRENSKICLYFAGDDSSNFLEFFHDLDDFGKCSFKIQRNKINEFSEYITTIYEQNKFLKQKEAEILSIQMSFFLKTKENDELRLKIAQLESNLLYQKERNSYDSSDDLQSQKLFDCNEHVSQTYAKLDRLPSRRTEPELNIFPSMTQEKTSKQWIGLKSESSSNIFFNSQNTKKVKPILRIEGYEEVLEINYYEEFASLKEKFLQTNKEFIKIQKEKNSLFEELKKKKEELLEQEKINENFKKESNEENERLRRDKERLLAKNKELHTELNDLYDVYNKQRFFKLNK